MSHWLEHFIRSLADQAGTWFVGFILALLGIFSGKLVETVKFALNRADLRTKYFEELALDLSQFLFVIDRLIKVSYGSTWASDDDKSAIAQAYNETMTSITRKEYVYRSWLQRYWDKSMVDAFTQTMEKIREVDAALIRLNEEEENALDLRELKDAYNGLKEAAQKLLLTAT